MKRLIFSAAISFIIINNTHAQETCKVALEALQGKYEGGCKDGKANGEGNAEGIDKYKGNFKNGLPDGAGQYTWANNNKYIGDFKKGQMEGKGEMRYITQSGADSLVTGYWKKNKYVGLYEKAYEVTNKTTKVNKVEFQVLRKPKTGATINLTSTSALGAAPVLVDISVIMGQYVNQNVQSTQNSSSARIMQIIFPFKARFQYSNGQMVEILFNEEADYEVGISFL